MSDDDASSSYISAPASVMSDDDPAVTLHDPCFGKMCKTDLIDERIHVLPLLAFFQAVQLLWMDVDGIPRILGTQSVGDTSLSKHKFKPDQRLEVIIVSQPPQPLPQLVPQPPQPVPQPPQIEEYKYEDTYVTVGGKTFVSGIRMNKNTLESEISLRALLNLIPEKKRVKLVSKDGDYEIEIDKDHSKKYYPYISYPGVGTKENPWFLVSAHGECLSRFDFLKHIFPSWSNKNYKKLR